MIKATNIFEKKDEGHELTKKLTRNVSESVRRVDELSIAARSIFSLFNPGIVSARLKLRDACEKAITNGKNNSVKFEEVLWRKVYYEPFSLAKKFRKGSSWQSSEMGVVWMHLDDGISFYQQLIVSINDVHENDSNTDLLPSNFNGAEDGEVLNGSLHVKESIFHCLTYLGDLSRYLLDLPSYAGLETSHLVSVRYYHQALHCNREAGLTHSNLATVYSSSKQPLLATLHFLRAMTCNKPFEAAEVSLKLMLEKIKAPSDKSSQNHTKITKQVEIDSAKFLNSCLLLVSNFLVNKNSEDSSNICQDVLVQLGKLLDNYDNDPYEVCDGSKKFCFELEPESMVVLCAVFIICTKRLENIGSPQCNMSEVLIVSILLTLLTHINARLEQRFSLVDPTFTRKLLPKIEKDEEAHSQTSSGSNNTAGKEDSLQTSKKYSNLRRRRRKAPVRSINGINGHLESEHFSDSVSEKDLSSADTDDDIDSISLPSSEDDLDDDDEDVIIESDEEWEGLTAWEHFNLVSQEGMMAAVFVMLDWLCISENLLKSCTVSAKSLWHSLAKFFNLININYQDLIKAQRLSDQQELIGILKDEEEFALLSPLLASYCLPEEVMLHLVIPAIKQQVIKPVQNLNSTNLYRLICLKHIKFKLLAKRIIPLKSENGLMLVSKSPVKLEQKKIEQSAIVANEMKCSPKRNTASPQSVHVTSSMQALTAQWLQHEVKNLEKSKGGATLGGLYLVPDVNVMIHHLAAVKKIVVSGTHMIIIPQIVIDELDQQKKESSGVREAIRWLELKLSRGSRFVRVQRAHEKTKLPLIKYPKRKDKDAWQWFHLAECCYYLGAQMGYVNKKKKSTVTLLTGENGVKTIKRTFSQHTLAEASGAVLMNVQEFMSKWHSSTKGQS